MAAADLRDELSCSICLSIYTDPVTLRCGHNFCRGCILRVLGTQERSGAYSCPECRKGFTKRPSLPRNRTLGNIADRFRPETETGETGIFCTYCVISPVPAAKSCLHCEASLCETHLRVHSKSEEHVLIQPSDSFMERKCSVHKRILEFYCCETCICVSCCLPGEHRGHRVELLSEASEKKKEKVRKVLEKLRPEREKTERRAQKLEERRREVAEKAAGETERVTALFRDIREQLEALEKRLLSDISSQKEKLSLTLTDLIHQLEIKKDELSRKIRHIEELCNMADPLTVLQERESHGVAFCGTEGADNEEEYDTEEEEYDDTERADNEGGRERDDIKVPAVGDLDVDLISETLLTGLTGIVTGVKGRINWQEATDLLMDINTAGNDVSVSGNRKSASYSCTYQHYPQSPERFQHHAQILSSRSFLSGRHYWEVEVSESGEWQVGVAYPSIERGGDQSDIGNNNKSWCLYRRNNNNYRYSVGHNSKWIHLPHIPSCRRIRIRLDYEAGRLSFYELSEPIRYLHTFTVTFTEPLHAVFWVGWDTWVRIIS